MACFFTEQGNFRGLTHPWEITTVPFFPSKRYVQISSGALCIHGVKLLGGTASISSPQDQPFRADLLMQTPNAQRNVLGLFSFLVHVKPSTPTSLLSVAPWHESAMHPPPSAKNAEQSALQGCSSSSSVTHHCSSVLGDMQSTPRPKWTF